MVTINQNAKWIKASEYETDACYEFQSSHQVEGAVKKAVLSISAMGMYIAYINGKRIGNELFAPYWTSYDSRTQYQTYDVTTELTKSFDLKIVCAEGWAVGYLRAGAAHLHRHHYAENIALIYSLDIFYEDGRTVSICSDEKVKVTTSQILTSSIYHGEHIDRTAAVRELGYALIDEKVQTTLIPQEGEKVTEQEVLEPVSYIVTPKGEKVIDFGQDLSGYVQIHTNGKHGEKIVISHAEVLDSDGNFYTDNLRTAEQKNTYVLSGGKEIFKPYFTWQGFRYIRLDEYPFEQIDLSCFKAIVVHSDMKRTGWFECGNEKINQLYHNVIWGQKSNFIDVPTDCPQRDERLGWTGDAQVFCRTAAINYDVEKFFTKWLGDLAADQKKRGDGGAGWLAPSCNLWYYENTSSVWGDAATICPWEIYMAYGNKEILERQYESMTSWVEYIRAQGDEEYLWIGGKQLGDWLALDGEEGSRRGATSESYISSAFFAYSTLLVVKAGKVLGRDVSKYEELYQKIVEAFQREFIKDGVPASNTQTAHVLALYFHLTDNAEVTAKRLAQMIKENGTKLTTGFTGTPYILHALSENGYTGLAYDLLLQEEIPSWLYQVNHGATTIWEHWDGIRADGSFWDASMNSYNHYAYGSVYDWIFGVAAGIKIEEAGYKKVTIMPKPDKRLGYIKAGIETRYGKLQSCWHYNGETIQFEYEIPNGVIADLILPDGTQKKLSGGKWKYENLV